MPILTSPTVAIVEKDYSQVTPFAANGEGAIAGKFSKGPMLQPIMVTTPDELESIFGKPDDSNYVEWFSAYNFLQYSGKLWVVRVKPPNVKNAGAKEGMTPSGGVLVLNSEDFDLQVMTHSANLYSAGEFVCREPGLIGNSIQVILVDNATWSAFVADTTLKSAGKHLSEYCRFGKPDTSTWAVEATGNATVKDEILMFVIDVDGKITGQAGTILEQWEGLSKISNAVDHFGRNVNLGKFVNNYSKWVYWVANPEAEVSGLVWDINSSAAISGTFQALPAFYNETMVGAAAGDDLTASASTFTTALNAAYDTLKNKELYSVSYLIGADYPVAAQQYLIQSIAESRKDAVAFVSPHDVDGEKSVPFLDPTTIITDLKTYRQTTLNINSSYAVMDSGYKYQFDGFNQKYRWVPLAADVAGLCARNDVEAESWYSPGGFTRGQIKNALKLSSNLNQAARDQLYPVQINAVVAFPGKGTVLFGDRTLQSKPSAFQSIHIRRMFIIIEKAIEDAAKYQLFELNTKTTRNLFVGMIEPFLQSVKARDGLGDFAVVCNETNNPDDAVARGEFTADIYIKPLYSIQYVVLNFVAVKSSVQFNQFIKA